MEKQEWLNCQQSSAIVVDTNGFPEFQIPNGVPNAIVPIGIKKGAQKTYNQSHNYICKQCGVLFHRGGANSERVKFCSLKCKYDNDRGKTWRGVIAYRKTMAELAKTPPVIGEKRTAAGIGGKIGGAGQWAECPQCHQCRWVRDRPERKNITDLCKKCYTSNQRNNTGEKSRAWKGGKHLNHKGYYDITLSPSDFFYPMINRTGSVMEHRLVMAKHLGRCLQKWEVVHHKNHIKTDNRIENLQLHTTEHHEQITILENRIRNLEDRLSKKENECQTLKCILDTIQKTAN